MCVVMVCPALPQVPPLLSSGALEAQRLKYEEQLSKLKEQLESSNVTSPVSTNQSKIKYTT